MALTRVVTDFKDANLKLGISLGIAVPDNYTFVDG